MSSSGNGAPSPVNLPEGRYSVAFPRRAWYPVARSGDLGRKPLAFSLMDDPLVAFRGPGGAPQVLADRCPHRNYPLSLGRATPAGTLECGYHGWQFDGCGTCVEVPGLLSGDEAGGATRRATHHPATEQDGFVWVWGEAGGTPSGDPFPLPDFEEGTPSEVVFDYDLDCTLHAALENALDVPHTAFLHRGIFRGGSRQRLTAVRREVPGGVEAQYLGEPVGFGPFRPKTEKTFDHWDRFFLPSIAQIEYGVEGWVRIVNTILHLPISPFRTRAWFVVRYWSRVPGQLVKPVVLARGKQILRQDARALAAQTDRIRQAGGERYSSTDLDILGNAIWRLLRQAERAEAGVGGTGGNGHGEGAPDPAERSVTFEV